MVKKLNLINIGDFMPVNREKSGFCERLSYCQLKPYPCIVGLSKSCDLSDEEISKPRSDSKNYSIENYRLSDI